MLSRYRHHHGMEQRGVARPDRHGHDPDHGAHPERGREQVGQRHEKWAGDHRRTLWAPLTVAVLGAWLLSNPFTFGYRGAALWNEVISGLLLMGLALVWSKRPRHPAVPWAACFAGIWLQFAPLAFRAENPAAYVTETFVGAGVIALAVLILGMPNLLLIVGNGAAMPRGWSYNPSSWAQRAPLVASAVVGWLISRYLAAYQLGYIDSAWDPFFGNGSEQVLNSEISRAGSIPDAGLGAFAYTVLALWAFLGGSRRWRSSPWTVLVFGVLLIPLGLMHIALVVMQPVLVGRWCTLCLAAAAVMLFMIPLAVDEIVAAGQFLWQSRRAGQPLWKTFCKGAAPERDGRDDRTPEALSRLSRSWPAMFLGMSFPWTLVLSATAGFWVMVAPAAYNMIGRAADSNELAGGVVITMAVISMAEVLRAGRWLTLLLGGWIATSPFLLGGASQEAQSSNAVVGILLILLSVPRGQVKQRYGAWDRLIV